MTKRILMTGATDGIGLETARQLLKNDVELILLCRNQKKGEQVKKDLIDSSGNDRIRLIHCDLASLESIRDAAEQVLAQFVPLDVIINCAGVYQSERQVSVDGFEMHFAVNYLASYSLTRLLLPAMNQKTPARIVIVSGETARFGKIHFDDLQHEKKFSTLRAYAQSKLANIMFAFSLGERLQGANIQCVAMHPGPAATSHLKKGPAWLNWLWTTALPGPANAASRVATLALKENIGETSHNYYFGKQRFWAPFPAYSKDKRDRLWQISEELTRPKLAA